MLLLRKNIILEIHIRILFSWNFVSTKIRRPRLHIVVVHSKKKKKKRSIQKKKEELISNIHLNLKKFVQIHQDLVVKSFQTSNQYLHHQH
jgi:septum formation topological specificity factor MinE